mmetsp:Transcript_3831/g.4416  ORF Transcript_3831/g.4416 Transcript_3831/m.4416 type:complete len:80 (-) Transcript_3831:259-498(-)
MLLENVTYFFSKAEQTTQIRDGVDAVNHCADDMAHLTMEHKRIETRINQNVEATAKHVCSADKNITDTIQLQRNGNSPI